MTASLAVRPVGGWEILVLALLVLVVAAVVVTVYWWIRRGTRQRL